MHLPAEQIDNMNQFDMPGHRFLTVDLGGIKFVYSFRMSL